jgi:hypothetical protein
MRPKTPTRKVVWTVAATVLLFGTLVIWPAYSHLAWHAGRPGLHVVPAFFLGGIVLVVLGGIVRSVVGCRVRGARWVISAEAGRTALITAAFAVTVIAMFYNVELWRGKRAFARVVKQADALGEPLDLQALRPPAVPEEKNFARIPVLAPLQTLPETTGDELDDGRAGDLGLLDVVAGRALAFIRDRSDAQPWMSGQYRDLETGTATPELSRNGAEESLRQLAPLEDLLRDVKRGSQLPECQFPWPAINPLFSDRIAMQDKTLIGLQLALAERAAAKLRTDEEDAAFEDVLAGLRITEHLHGQRALSYAAPRIHTIAMLLQPCWEGLAQRHWTAAQLTALQAQLESFDPASRRQDRLRFQILAHADLVESLIPTHKTGSAGLSLSEVDQATLDWIRLVYPRGWSLQNQAALHAFHFELMQSVVGRSGRPTGLERHVVRRLIRGSSDPCFAVFLVPKAVEMTSDHHESLVFKQAVLNLARSAVALERFRLREGAYPDELTRLVPDLLASVPDDPVTGEALHYRRKDSGGFVVYSVGMDGQDNGGTPPPAATDGGGYRFSSDWDWVWFQPPANH